MAELMSDRVSEPVSEYFTMAEVTPGTYGKRAIARGNTKTYEFPFIF